MLLGPIWSVISLVVLYFDGSFIPNLTTKSTTAKPTVPFFPYTNTFSKELRPIASCGAAIVLEKTRKKRDINANNGKHTSNLLAAGGKSFPPHSLTYTSLMTSAHAEYEGLLLGLRWILDQLENHNNKEPLGNNEQLSLFDPNYHDNRLVIRGDCKVVISQIKGDSIPRKLSQQYEDTMQLLQQIQFHLSNMTENKAEYVMKTNITDQISIELIGREENKIADAISRIASNTSQRYAHMKIESLFQNALNEIKEKDKTKMIACLSKTQKRKKVLPCISSSPFFDVIRTIMSCEWGSLISHKSRVTFLRNLSLEAEKMGDGLSLAAIGGALRVEATRISTKPRSSFSSLQNNPKNINLNRDTGSKLLQWKNARESMNIEGVLLEVKALRLLGLEKDAIMLEKKIKHRLEAITQKPKKSSDNNGEFLDELRGTLANLCESLDGENHVNILKAWECAAQNSLSDCETVGLWVKSSM